MVLGGPAGPIETERLVLEPWHERRLADFARLASDPLVMRYVGSGAPWSRDKAESDFALSLEHWRRHGFGKRSLVERESGSWLGFVELCRVGPGAGLPPDEVEIGWWLLTDAWGRGFATEAARRLRDDSFERVGLGRIVGRYRPANGASGRVMEKIGMRYERNAVGRNGEALRIFALDRAGWITRSRPNLVG